MLFVEQKYKVQLKGDRIENGTSHTQFQGNKSRASANKKIELKVKL